jgi:Na+-transporting methylmalonyl-CoA/oxaloacetate decarboxylase gamma subunit
MSEQVKKGMTTKAKVVVVVLALLALVVAAIFSTISLRSSDPELRVNNTKVTLEIAQIHLKKELKGCVAEIVCHRIKECCLFTLNLGIIHFG